MKSSYLFLSYFLLHSLSISAQENSQLFLSYDVAKSLHHLSQNGYSHDVEMTYLFSNTSNLGVTLTYGDSQYYRKEFTRANVRNYTVQGFYINPQITFLFPSARTKNYDLFFSGGVIFTQFEEKLNVFIPTKHFEPFVSEIKFSNLESWGINANLNAWFFRNKKISFMLGGELILAGIPVSRDIEVIGDLALRYMPGAGTNFMGTNIISGGLFTNVNLSVKIVYKIFSL